jgi:hypothetical protein
VSARSAGRNDDAVEFLHCTFEGLQFSRENVIAFDVVADGFGHGVRLLIDFPQHVVAKLAGGAGDRLIHIWQTSNLLRRRVVTPGDNMRRSAEIVTWGAVVVIESLAAKSQGRARSKQAEDPLTIQAGFTTRSRNSREKCAELLPL